MNGRLENDNKIEKGIEQRLLEAPSYVIEWNEYLKASGKTAATRKDFIYKVLRFLKTLNPKCELVKIEDITSTSVIVYFSSLQTKKKNEKINYTSDSYKQTIWSCLNNFFTYLFNRKLIKENPIKYIDRPDNKDWARIKASRKKLTYEDFQKILDSVENGVGTHKAKRFQIYSRKRDLCIMLLFMNTGMRKSALISLDVDDVDFENHVLRVYDKGKIMQQHNMNENLEEAMKKWLQEREIIYEAPDDGALFISKNGNRISATALDNIVKKYTEDALGYELSPHKLRAGLATILKDKGCSVDFIQAVLGHANISTTQRYIVTDKQERKIASEIMAGLT